MYSRIKSILQPLTRSAGGRNGLHPSYAELYEHHAQCSNGSDAIGVGNTETIGQLELEILKQQGLSSETTLLDFGCGVGRLGRYAIPYLSDGSYIGVDIAPTMIKRAKARCGLESGCQMRWLTGDINALERLEQHSVDMACAYSVFTHMDAEDFFNHLKALRRVVKDLGMLVSSHLLLPESDDARQLFLQSASTPYAARRRKVITVVSCRQMVEQIAAMAGWQLRVWIPAEQQYSLTESASTAALGQSVCVLVPAA